MFQKIVVRNVAVLRAFDAGTSPLLSHTNLYYARIGGLPPTGGPPLCIGKRRNTMANKRPKPKEIVTKLRQVEVLKR